MTLQERKQEVIDEFSMFDEWLDKYQYLIDSARNLPALEESKKTAEKLINGCQSRVWIGYTVQEGKIFFSADSDALITKGIIALLLRVYSGCTPEQIVGDDFGFLDTIGLKENLSPTRSNGLSAMINTIKAAAAENILIHG